MTRETLRRFLRGRHRYHFVNFLESNSSAVGADGQKTAPMISLISVLPLHFPVKHLDFVYPSLKNLLNN